MQGTTTSQRALKQVIDSITLPKLTKKDEKELHRRLEQHFPALFERYYALYGSRYDFFLHLQKLVRVLCEGFAARNRKLKTKIQFDLRHLIGFVAKVYWAWRSMLICLQVT